jgi:hypothetical protein
MDCVQVPSAPKPVGDGKSDSASTKRAGREVELEQAALEYHQAVVQSLAGVSESIEKCRKKRDAVVNHLKISGSVLSMTITESEAAEEKAWTEHLRKLAVAEAKLMEKLTPSSK